MAIGSMAKTTDKVWVEISEKAVRHNVGRIREIIGPGVSLLAVVKADAYGLGLTEVSGILWQSGVDFFGVSDVREGRLLRETLPASRIMILGPSFRDHVEEILDADLVPMVSSLDFLRRLNEVALLKGSVAKVHLMMDTGMGRIGLWYEKGEDFFKELLRLEAIEIEGVASHFASSDGPDLGFTHLQLRRFQEFLFKLEVMGWSVPYQHVASSAALLRLPQSRFNMVRSGILLYGVFPSSHARGDGFESALSWKTRVAFVKEVQAGRTVSYGATFVATCPTRIATLPVGYAHGYDRALSNRGEVLIGGRRFPVVGRVTMDQIMVDLGPQGEARVDDEVVIVGRQNDAEITWEELAAKSGTIPYELLCRLKAKKVIV